MWATAAGRNLKLRGIKPSVGLGRSTMASSSKEENRLAGRTFFLDDFAEKLWEESAGAARLTVDKGEFVKRVEEEHERGASLVEGYAPFCKHIFVPNFVGAKVGALPITDKNEHLLATGYVSRREGELPVLSRWFPAEKVEPHEAAYIDVILYSREQIAKEREARGLDPEALPSSPWGIISLKFQDESYETPMQPITMMRNALGKSEGGSGVPLDRHKYMLAVEYWQNRAPVG